MPPSMSQPVFKSFFGSAEQQRLILHNFIAGMQAVKMGDVPVSGFRLVVFLLLFHNAPVGGYFGFRQLK